MMRFVLVSWALCLSASANAADWEYITTSTDGTRFSIDLETVKVSERFASVWVEMDFSEVKSEKARKAVQLWKYNCQAQTSFTASSLRYAADGSVLSTNYPNETTQAYQPVVPGTIDARMMKLVCTDPNAQN